jgi:hypothetical protein
MPTGVRSLGDIADPVYAGWIAENGVIGGLLWRPDRQHALCICNRIPALPSIAGNFSNRLQTRRAA